jgi:hypothetical protein
MIMSFRRKAGMKWSAAGNGSLRGEGKSYTMEEAHELIRKQYREKKHGI